MRRLVLSLLALALLPIFRVPASAQMSNMPEDLRTRLAEINPTWGKDILGNVATTLALYTPLLAAAPKDGVRIERDLAYGPDALHRLDLDEPTIGLDPNQIRQVRELIKNLGGKRTVLISTHILPEVEIMCSRVIVIHKGKIRASDTAENLLKNQRTAGSMRIEAKVGNDNAAAELQRVPGVKDVTTEKDGDYDIFQLRLEANTDPSEQVMQLAANKRWAVREITRRRPTLEDVFVELTHSDS